MATNGHATPTSFPKWFLVPFYLNTYNLQFHLLPFIQRGNGTTKCPNANYGLQSRFSRLPTSRDPGLFFPGREILFPGRETGIQFYFIISMHVLQKYGKNCVYLL